MTPTYDDQELSAYLDGELDGETHRRLERVLAVDLDARRRLTELREQDAAVRAALSGPMVQPLPEDLKHRVQSMFAGASNVQVLGARQRPKRPSLALMALAASVVVAFAGLLAAFIVLEQRLDQRLALLEVSRDGGDQAHRDSALTVALESQLSGDAVAWINPDTGASGTITPMRTFKAVTEDWCREYLAVMTQNGITQVENGIACRTNDGIWRTRVLTLESPESSSPEL